MQRSGIFIAIPFVSLIACSGTSADRFTATDADIDSSASDGGAASIEQSAASAAAAYCKRANDCAPAFVSFAFGDRTSCEQAFARILVTDSTAPGSNQTPANLATCAAAVANVSCEDLLGRKLPSECAPVPGTRANGATCASDSQCAGTRCRTTPTQVCGACAARVAANESCSSDDDCVNGSKCTGEKCAPYVGRDGSCDATHPCNPMLACRDAKCTDPRALGDKCEQNEECDSVHGFLCDPKDKKCQPVLFAAPGSACGIVKGDLTACKGPGSHCRGAIAPAFEGICMTPAAEGQPCDTSNGPLCGIGSRCINSVCSSADPATCQ